MDATLVRLTGPGSPFELAPVESAGRRCKIFRHGPHTLSDLYRRSRAMGQRPYVICGEQSLTYDQVFGAASALSYVLVRRCGVVPGMRVGVLLGNSPQWLLAFVAVTSLGGTAVALQADRPAMELISALDLTLCSVVISSSSGARQLAELGDRRPTVVMRDGESRNDRPGHWLVFDTADTQPGAPGAPIDPEQEALVAFTSGTTSAAKAVLSTHRNLMTGLMNMMLGAALSAANMPRRQPVASGVTRAPQTATLVAAPFSHVSGFFSLLLMGYLGGKVVTLPSWNVQGALGMASRESVQSLVGATPAVLRALLAAESSRSSLQSLRSISSQGSALDAVLVREIGDLLPHTIIGTSYGMTETNGSVCVASMHQVAARPTSCGLPLPTVELRIVPDGNAVSRSNEPGEVWLRGAMVMKGYCTPVGQPSAFDGDWFRTGDLGRVDEDGFLHIIGRADVLTLDDGRRIPISDIERVLMRHPAIEQGTAILVSGNESHQHLVVTVVRRAGHGCREEEIATWLHGSLQLADIRPRVLELDNIPQTASGKTNQSELRARVLEHLQSDRVRRRTEQGQ
jgi:long-chain acyl-CoA synthetase